MNTSLSDEAKIRCVLISSGINSPKLASYSAVCDIARVSKYIHKSHNVSVLLYHLVCLSKYRRVVFTEEVDNELRDICLEILKRYEIRFLEIGVDRDHVHFLIQSIPMCIVPRSLCRRSKVS